MHEADGTNRLELDGKTQPQEVEGLHRHELDGDLFAQEADGTHRHELEGTRRREIERTHQHQETDGW